ncbi:hypothetical protein L6452_01485 [Arctium lappa]|uniref:Uncharacterized protein n=1 Tax=Arctium lappa TaxID=4217 RepID=A0ACB9FGT1_ARCLA|nr:hypothetical protein L6452_01485 [Arctium lappa]
MLSVAPTTSTTKGLKKFLKKTLIFPDISSSFSSSQEDVAVRKGYLAVWVGIEEEEMKKFVIPTDYLAHQAFSFLLRDAEEKKSLDVSKRVFLRSHVIPHFLRKS